MTVTVEANSLSDITQIASNPPNFPRNPAEEPRRPLTLYIARVPGSNDIILTTLKPLTQNVTAQDVISSLYYFHVNSDEDIQPSLRCSPKLPGDPVDLALPKTKTFSIRRKPVPGSVHSTSPQPSSQPSSQTDQAIPRNPLGPRSITSASTIERKPVLGAHTQNTELTKTTSHPCTAQYQNQEPNPSSVLRHKKSYRAFSVTIIRRDPPSRAQWNIGTISGHPLAEEASNGRHGSRSTKKPYYDISLSLKTPGYARFREQYPVIDQMQSSNPNEASHRESSSTFLRKVTMEGSSFWNRASAQRKRAISDLSDKYRTSRGLQTQENDHSEHDVKAHGKGYVFMSPWGGRCKFVTGSGGRSLRCHHKLPSPVSANSTDLQRHSVTVSELRFNLPISLLAYSTNLQSIDRKSDMFSESQYKDVRNRMSILKLTGPPLTHRIRANSAFNQRSDDEGHLVLTRSRNSTDSREKNYFETPETSKNSIELMHQNSKEDDTSNKYLDLGREKAGGGSNGKHAKLGKMIIYDEGIKMLDLIVSANMAIWWSVWDGF
ncbi:putative oxidoreductase-like protein [Erysiphe neolycopersici]|uniref:Putative oxidoreductase-like protein n=1 Tax=Erysiphe neolycopersici TaxID=212602 RepID=A0A420HYA0_9PEZI|nr:putative oxidoreductase-like protein [Erysiphe neolycopersici]